jgi:hypothetical protein
MDAQALFEHIQSRFPETKPKLTNFPSGAFMIDLIIHGDSYCVEYLPSRNLLGLSKSEQISPFFEGIEESFATLEELQDRIAKFVEQ